MASSLLSAHHEFFNEHGFISFENLINEENLDKAKSKADQKLPLSKWTGGRDLFLEEEKRKKTFTTRRIAKVLHDLLRDAPKALLFDQLLPSPDLIAGPLPEFYKKEEVFLRDIFSLQGLNCGILICLRGGNKDSVFYPREEGMITIFQGKKGLPIASLNEMRRTCFLLLGFGNDSTCYTYQKMDPASQIWRDLNLAPGDKLHIKSFPQLPLPQ